MRITVVIAAFALALSACASSPRAAPNDDNTPPPAPAPDTGQAPGAPAQAIASPRDSAKVEVAGATVTVDYGRPFMRGRQIFGGLVPFDQVWRTGANEATALRTTADLQIDVHRIPAGEYTLYSLLQGSNGTVGEWTLIVNRQTGQWGTEYDASRDLVRIPMRVTQLDAPIEQFTIRVVPNGGDARSGRLIMMWERTQAQLDFRLAG